MKSLLVAASLLMAVPLLPAQAQPQLPQLPQPQTLPPDLVISSITPSASHVGVGTTFTWTVTAKNNGRGPCAGFNLTMLLPAEVNLLSTSGPLRCPFPVGVRIIGRPMEMACRGVAGDFFLWSGQSVTTTFTVSALTAASGVTATAVVDRDAVCFEANENNNKATSQPVVFFDRPSLEIAQNPPYPAVNAGRDQHQDFPVTITNKGKGNARNVAFAITVPFIAAGAPYSGPQLVLAYKGALLPANQAPAQPLQRDCSVSRNNTTRMITQICVVPVTLLPEESLQVVLRTLPCPPPTGVPISVPVIHLGTEDDTAANLQIANLHRACTL